MTTQEVTNLAPIFSAIVALQKQVRSVEQNAKGGGGKYTYTTMGVLLDAALPTLTEHGVGVVQPIVSDGDGGSAVQTIFIHESGVQWLASLTPIPDDSSTVRGGCSAVQNFGANSTYMRRYSLAAALGISSEKDTDGVAHQPTNNRAKPSGLSEGQQQQIKAIVANSGMPVEQAKAINQSLGFSRISEASPEQYNDILAAYQSAARNIETQKQGQAIA